MITLIRRANPDDAAAIDAHEVWVADGDAALAGALVLIRPAGAGEPLLLDTVAVDPAAQGAGLGRRLLDLAIGRARALARPALDLYTHVRMQSNLDWYRRAGFVETGRRREHGFERVFLRLALGPTPQHPE